MRDRNATRLHAAIAGTLVLLLLLVSYRARSFHYCAGFGEGGQGRAAVRTEPCLPDEGPMDWRALGMRSKLKVALSTTAKALGAN